MSSGASAVADLPPGEPSPEPTPEVAAAPEAKPDGPMVWIPAARPAVVTAVEAAGAVAGDTADGAAFAVVSTRLARHRIGEYIATATAAGLRSVVLVHPGGESIAVEALRSGGHTAIAEGDAEALRWFGKESEPHPAHADDDADDTPTSHDGRAESLLDAFEASLGRSQSTSRGGAALVDSTSGLPAEGALQARLAAATPDAELALRVVVAGIPGLVDGQQRFRMGNEAAAILHRRIAGGMKLLTTGLGDLFDLGDGSFVLLAPKLAADAVDQLGASMAAMVEAYIPDGHVPLTVAVGHAGPECSLDPATLRELAGRAEMTARQEDGSAVLGAGELVKPLALATEMEVAIRLAALGAGSDGPPRTDVADIAHDIAVRLGFDNRERLLVRFCATVADAGKAVSSDDVGRGEATARLLGPTAGPSVAAALRALDERWDGSGSPDGLVGAAIPIAARIIAVAERLVADGRSTDGIDAGNDTAYDPTVVRAAREVVKQP